uniref:Tim44-like domain-containing protein n=1 Tax=Araucaria cunninghamii TaxID=56994 RepID=A0A0D6R7W3_ARACU
MGSRMLGRNFRGSSRQIFALYRSWHQATNNQTPTFHLQSGLNTRHMSVFNEFSKRVKGEVESNPELQKSIKELKEKAGEIKAITEDLKVRTKQTTEHLYKHADAVRTEAETKAKQVSAAMKDKISAATEQAKELRENFKVGIDGSKEKARSDGGETSNSEGNSATGTAKTEATDFASSQETGGTSETLFSKFGKRVNLASSSASAALKSLKEAKIIDVTKKGYNLVKDELTSTPSRRRKMESAAAASTYKERSSATSMVPVAAKQTRWGKKWEEFKEKARVNPLFKRVMGISEHPAVAKSQELAEDIRERWETSDSPVVHKIQDLNETIFGETPAAISYKEIRRRDPYFSLPDFIADVQEMIKPTLQAYLKGDLETLKKNCSFEVIDRCKAERRAYESQGIFFDNKILHISDVEVKETKLMGNTPIIIIAFQTQQTFCVRDRTGKITEGGEDDIHTVYYAWAMQQMDAGEMGESEFYPTWRLREMQQLGIQSLI